MKKATRSSSGEKVTIIDIAKAAGVSITTVSRVINHTLPVTEETERRVWEAIERLDYHPNSAARNLARQKTRTIGLILPGISGAYFPYMLAGIENCTNENGFDLLIYASPKIDQDQKTLHHLPVGEHNTDGLLIFSNSISDAEISYFHKRNHPMVLLHRMSPLGLKIPSVVYANKSSSERLIDHLIEVHGCKRIAFMAGPVGNEDSFWREIGYKASLAKHGLQADPALRITGGFNGPIAAQAIRDLLNSGVRPDAIFTGDDEAAAGVIAELVQMGYHLPDDMAVVGFDDDYLAAYLPVPLTTIRAPIESAGYEATRQLIQLITTGSADLETIIQTEVVIRRSCGCKF